MKRETAKAEREQRPVAAVIDFLGLIAVLEKLDPPNPDFLIRCADGTCSYAEVTETTDKALQSARAKLDNIRDRIMQGLERKRIPVWVRISYDGNKLPPLDSRTGCVREISDVLIKLVGEALKSGADQLSATELRQFQALRCIEAVRLAPRDVPLCTTGGSRLGPTSALLVQAVAKKESKLAGYRNVMKGPIWLVLHGSARFGGSIATEVGYGLKLQTRFDRVFMFNEWDECVIELERSTPDESR